MKEVLARAPAAGLTQLEVRRSWLDAGGFGTDRDYDRYALMRGHQTGSKDGAPVAPLLGTIKGYDERLWVTHGVRSLARFRRPVILDLNS